MRLVAKAIAGLALAIAGCQAVPEREDGQGGGEVPRILRVGEATLVCFGEPEPGASAWVSTCAPLGPWMRCRETESQIQCAPQAVRGGRAAGSRPEPPRTIGSPQNNPTRASP